VSNRADIDTAPASAFTPPLSLLREARGSADVSGVIPDFVLNGIMILGAGPEAIINNSVVEEGDKIGDAQVETIDDSSVVLKYKGKKITLKLK